jgi:hypothetical protein
MFHQPPLGCHVVNRQQLYRGYAQTGEVLQDRIGYEAQVGASEVFRHTGVQHGHSFDVALVDHGFVPGRSRRPVVSPGEGGLYNDAFRNDAGAVR